MGLKIILSEGRRLVFEIDSRPIIAALERAYQQMYAKAHRRIIHLFSVLHEVGHCWLQGMLLDWYWLFDRTPSIYRIFDWFLPGASEEIYRRNWFTNAIVYSEKLRVQILQLAEQYKRLALFFCEDTPRHQDRGSGDAVSHIDNFTKKESYNCLRLRQYAQHLYKLNYQWKREEIIKCRMMKFWTTMTT